jgi:hypothetical protein
VAVVVEAEAGETGGRAESVALGEVACALLDGERGGDVGDGDGAGCGVVGDAVEGGRDGTAGERAVVVEETLIRERQGVSESIGAAAFDVGDGGGDRVEAGGAGELSGRVDC